MTFYFQNFLFQTPLLKQNNTECNQLKPITKFVWRRLGHGSTHCPSDLLWISRYVFIIAIHCHIVKKKSTHLSFIFERFPIFLNTQLFFSRRLIKSEKWPRPSSSLKYQKKDLFLLTVRMSIYYSCILKFKKEQKKLNLLL